MALTNDEIFELLSRVTKALLYLNTISNDAGLEPLGCIFNIMLITILSGPKEVEGLHQIMHEHHDDLESRLGDKLPELPFAVQEFLQGLKEAE